MKRHALFVGVNTYDDPSIRPLRFSIPDASVLADRFGRLGFKTRLLPDPTGAELLSAVEDSVAGLGPGDVFLFFFAGHGFTAQDGAHLLFCRNDRQKLLRVNGAGVRVDALEALTDDGGFHRAFLLDSCRTDCLAGAEARGAATRDLDFVAMPASSAGAGSFFLLRSCDKFRPSLELDDLGHGLFTQGLLDAMDARDSRLASCDTSFAAAIREQMEMLQRLHHVLEPQRPSLGEVSGACFALFQDGFLKAGQAAPGVYAASTSPFVVCPLCGKKNRPEDTFRCRECGRDDLCLDHRDKATFLCPDCVRKEREKAAREAATWTVKGDDFYFGRGVEKDDAEAVKWYRKAADQGYALAQYNLGVMYANGRGVVKDDAEAVKWYRKAAEQGNEDAEKALRRRGML